MEMGKRKIREREKKYFEIKKKTSERRKVGESGRRSILKLKKKTLGGKFWIKNCGPFFG